MDEAPTNHRFEYGMTWNVAAHRKSIPVGVYPDPTRLSIASVYCTRMFAKAKQIINYVCEANWIYCATFEFISDWIACNIYWFRDFQCKGMDYNARHTDRFINSIMQLSLPPFWN